MLNNICSNLYKFLKPSATMMQDTYQSYIWYREMLILIYLWLQAWTTASINGALVV